MLRTRRAWTPRRRAALPAPRAATRGCISRGWPAPSGVASGLHLLDQPSPQTIPPEVDEVEERRASLLPHERRLGQVVHLFHHVQVLEARRDGWQVRSQGLEDLPE